MLYWEPDATKSVESKTALKKHTKGYENLDFDSNNNSTTAKLCCRLPEQSWKKNINITDKGGG